MQIMFDFDDHDDEHDNDDDDDDDNYISTTLLLSTTMMTIISLMIIIMIMMMTLMELCSTISYIFGCCFFFLFSISLLGYICIVHKQYVFKYR